MHNFSGMFLFGVFYVVGVAAALQRALIHFCYTLLGNKSGFVSLTTLIVGHSYAEFCQWGSVHCVYVIGEFYPMVKKLFNDFHDH